MDKITHEVRLANWTAIIQECENRPQGVSKSCWLKENRIPEKQYYYWLRRVRKASFSQAQLPVQTPSCRNELTLVELSGDELTSSPAKTPALVIRTRKSTVEFSPDLPEATLLKLLKAVAHVI